MNPTTLSYMTEQHKHDDLAVVGGIEREGRTCVLLDRTIFYPQGGGQAWDTGMIKNAKGAFAVQEVRFIDGLVYHYGIFTEGEFAVGDTVECHVDASRRHLNSRLHSAGHLLDEAVKNLGLGWTPTKGIHYPGQAAVEYSGTLDDAEVVKTKLQVEIDRLIAKGSEVSAQLVPVTELPALADYVPPNLPESKPVRIVNMGGAKSTPCGGTHVKNTAEIGALSIRYVKAKKGDIRVAYEIDGCP